MASNPEGPVTFVWTPVPTGNLTDRLSAEDGAALIAEAEALFALLS